MNKLYIDTQDNKHIVVSLQTKQGNFEKHSEAIVRSAQTILPLVKQVLTEAKITPQDLDEISVETGPGSYTGVRIGVAVANALSFSLQVKVNGEDLGKVIEPKY